MYISYKQNKKTDKFVKCMFILPAVILLLLLILLFVTGCNENKNPAMSSPDIIVGIDSSQTPSDSNQASPGQTFVAGSPSPGPYDPVIDFSDPYLELVIRELLSKSIGEIKLSDVQSITSLTARVKGIRSVADLTYFTSLEELDLYGNKVSDISALSKLTNLRVLNIGKNYNALYSSDISLSGLNLSPLSTLQHLEELYIEDNSISDISSLSSLSNLKIIDLSHNSISDISSVENFLLLEKINISYNKITDISPLAKCTKLKYIDASNNYYEIMSELNFYTGYGIKDISFIQDLADLSYINISMNMINSIEALSKLDNLRELYADDNFITDISCLKGNKTITVLSLRRNYIINFDAILSMNSLDKLEYEGNPVSQNTAIDNFKKN